MIHRLMKSFLFHSHISPVNNASPYEIVLILFSYFYVQNEKQEYFDNQN